MVTGLSTIRSTVLLLVILLGVPLPLSAQDFGQVVSPFLTIDQDRMFLETAIGQRIGKVLEQERARLEAETRRIEAELEAEELSLTEQRATLGTAEFRALADAFDEKVQTLRSDREAKQQALVQQIEAARADFSERVSPILSELVRELGGVAILDHRVILLSVENIDITQQAIQRIDNILGDGLAGQPDNLVPEPEPAPTPPPDASE